MAKATPMRTAGRRLAWRGVAAAAVMAALTAASWLIWYRQGASTDATHDPASALYSDALPAGGQTDGMIASLQARLRQYPGDARGYALLGAAYLQKAREAADPAYYAKAEAVLLEAQQRNPTDSQTLTTLGVLALARHQFQAGLDYGEQALALNPYSAQAMGVVVDAQTELGNYPAALEMTQRMVDTRPDMSSYARVSYARELNGEVGGALDAMRMAAQAGSGAPENYAWTLTQVGLLLFNHGDLPAAQAEFEAALRALPNYVPARAGLARVKAAQGDLTGAIGLYEELVKVMPLGEYVIALGDCYAAAGRHHEAQGQYGLVGVLAQLQQTNGVDTDLEIALFEADHPGLSEPIQATLSRAQRAYERRHTIYAADTLAWTLYQSGDADQAKSYSDEALRLNTQDALLWFHAGMIASRLGETENARSMLQHALNINPHFSLIWSDTAQATLQRLQAN
jgi:tetratricopeptide (TPR) repeat protein